MRALEPRLALAVAARLGQLPAQDLSCGVAGNLVDGLEALRDLEARETLTCVCAQLVRIRVADDEGRNRLPPLRIWPADDCDVLDLWVTDQRKLDLRG